MTTSIEKPFTDTALSLLEKELFLIGFKESHLKHLETSLNKVFTDYFSLDEFSISLDEKNTKVTKSLYYMNLNLQDSKHKIQLKFLKLNHFSEQNILDLKQIKKILNSIVPKVFLKTQKKELFNQWKLIFDSISTPLCLTDKSAKIYTANKKYVEFSKKNQDLLIGEDAFSTFFKPYFESYKIINKSAKNNFNIFEVQGVKIQKQDVGLQGVGLQDVGLQGVGLQDVGLQDASTHNGMYYYEVLNQNFKINTHRQEDISLYFFRDISQQKKIEKELLTKSQKVELGLISSSIAHELNNPVGSMLIYIDLVKHQIENNSPLQEDLTEIKTAILKCADIIKNLLSFAKK